MNRFVAAAFFSGLLFFLKFLDHSLCNVGPHINELFKVFWRDFAQNGGGFRRSHMITAQDS